MLKFKNATNGRFYYIIIQRDNTSPYAINIVYGGKHVSRNRKLVFNSNLALIQEIQRLTKRRIRRGYALIK